MNRKIAGLLAVAVVSGCEQDYDLVYTAREKPKAENVICNPLQSGTSSGGHGLSGVLRYSERSLVKLDEYFDETKSIDSGSLVFLSNVNVPTMSFTQGFPVMKNGVQDLVRKPDGTALVEYFALELQSEVVLRPEDREGYYEFAVAADDGTRLSIKENGTYQPIVAFIGTTSTRMNCATRHVYLTHETKLPILLRYFQGPRTEIALSLRWKYLGDTTPSALPGSSAVCNTAGNNFGRIESSDYVPLNDLNYVLPEGVAETIGNACQ